MYADSLNPTPPPITPAGSALPSAPSVEAQRRVDTPQVVIPQPRVKEQFGLEFDKKYKNAKVLVLGTHFASPTAGRVGARGSVFRFVP